MELENRIQALIAIGAAVSANCQPCLQSALALAVAGGAAEWEIREAVEVGKRVRRGAASKMDEFASEVLSAAPSRVTVDGGCGCGQV